MRPFSRFLGNGLCFLLNSSATQSIVYLVLPGKFTPGPNTFLSLPRTITARIIIMKPILLSLAFLCTVFTPLRGITFTVSNTNNSGVGSLRQAIDDANNTAGADVIVFSNTLANQTITVISPFLVITSDMTIDGSGASNLTISGGNTSRIFWIQNGTITIQNLTLADGYARGGGGAGGGMGAGGAIFMHEGKQDLNTPTGVLSGSIDLRLLNVTLKNNQAIGGTGGTGAAGGGGLGGNGGTGAGGVLGNGIQAGGSVTNASGNVGMGGYTPGTNGGIAIFGSGGSSNSDGTNFIPVSPPGFGGGAGAAGGNSGGFGGGGGTGSKGGFGGGGGTAPIGSGVIGGFGGGSGSFLGSGGFGGFGGGGAEGGAGAGFGGAIFVASGKLTLQGVTFDGNTATGGTGFSNIGKGKGYGGALFIFNKADNGNTAAPGTTNDPNVVGCGVTFISNSAADDPNSATNNDNLYGTITVNPASTLPTAIDPQVYAGTGTIADLTATGTGLTWYANATGGTALLSSQSLADGSTYYVSQSSATCESARVSVTVRKISEATQSLCAPATVADLVSTPSTGTTAAWFSNSTGGLALTSGTALTTGVYYVEQFLLSITTLGSGFSFPEGVAIQSDDKIVVADFNNNAIKRMNADGTGIETLGSGFLRPAGAHHYVYLQRL